MSGLEAIGAAAAILQFVDFGSKLLVTGYEVYKSHEGATPKAIHLETVCTELKAIFSQLSQAPAGNILSKNEQALWRLADRAHDLSWHLGLLLDSLRLKQSTFRSWGAIRQSWRVLHQKDKITEMATQLNEIKSLMDTSLLVLLRDDNSLLAKGINYLIRQSKHMHNDQITRVQALQQDLHAAIQQYQQSVITNIDQSNSVLLQAVGKQLSSLYDRSTDFARCEHILDSLYFYEMHSRESTISDKVAGTYLWIFDSWCTGHRYSCGCSCSQESFRAKCDRCRDYETPNPPCESSDNYQTHFLQWLLADTTGHFVVTGKPGSGKSTFMKFVADHEKTREALLRWAGGRELVLASFFFWSSGTPMQRSQEGLLRSLLYQILSQVPAATRLALPQRWKTASNKVRTVKPWSRGEISDAFDFLVESDALDANFSFFIDGLDEYGGSDLQHNETDLDLVHSLQKLSSSPHIKVCLSSRPRNVFKAHFASNGPRHITIHDHTQEDIEQLVDTRFDKLRGLIAVEDADLASLKCAIVERSEGVFLWVVLVVKELLDALEPPVSISELEERLSLLPATLDGYFQRTLNQLHPQYRRFTARLLLMSVSSIYRLDCVIVHLLWLLDQRPSDFCGEKSVIGAQLLQTWPGGWKVETRSRIHKTCGDLIAISELGFITHSHRSVADFLKLPNVKMRLLSFAEWRDESDIHFTFCRIYLAGCNLDHEQCRSHAREFMSHAMDYERHSGLACSDLVYELDHIMCSFYTPGNETEHEHWAESLMYTFGSRLPNKWRITEQVPLLLYAASRGLRRFVEQTLVDLTPQAAQNCLDDLLKFLVLTECFRRPSGWTSATMIAFLLSKGANINSLARTTTCVTEGDAADGLLVKTASSDQSREIAVTTTQRNSSKSHSFTVWEFFLRGVTYYPLFSEYVSFEALEEMIKGGADLQCRLPEDCENIQEALERRSKKFSHESYWERRKDGYLRRIRAALRRRGVSVREQPYVS